MTAEKNISAKNGNNSKRKNENGYKMIKLHDQTRKFLLFLLFFLLGPLLTLGILGGIVLRKIPINARNFEHHIAVQTGLTWKIETVEYRSPQWTRLKEVQILDDVSAKPIFWAPEIDIQFVASERLDKFFPNIKTTAQHSDAPIDTVTKWIKPSGYWQISVARSALTLEHYSDGNSAVAVQDAASRIFSRFRFLSETPVQIVFEKVGVFSTYSFEKPDKEPDLMRFVRGNLYRTETEIRSDWEFQLPEFSELETQHISFVRPHDSNNIEISLQTGKMPVSCRFAAVFCSTFRYFGSGSRFSGEFIVINKDGSDKKVIRMKNFCLQNLELAPIVKEYSPFTVTGTIYDFRILDANFSSEEFTARGCFQIVNGEMEKTLFHRFVDRFDLEVNPSGVLESPRPMIPFTACAVHFQLQPDGAVFRPDELWRNTLMYQKATDSETSQMTVAFPNDHRQPVSYHTILSVLAPDTAPVVPLTSGLKNLFSMIPVDDAAPAEIPKRKLVVPLPATQPPPAPAETRPMIANPVTIKPTSGVLFVDPNHNNNKQ
jgi:hypothetical protein